jgi:hypothetical protein
MCDAALDALKQGSPVGENNTSRKEIVKKMGLRDSATLIN